MRALDVRREVVDMALFHGDAPLLLICAVALSRQSQRQDAGNRTSGRLQRIEVAGGQVRRRASVLSTPEFSIPVGMSLV
jgi:hypothetical protein